MSKRTMFTVFAVMFVAALTNFVRFEPAQAMPAAGVDANAPAATAAWPYRPAQFVISALDNEQYLPSVAFNWKHNEYLVVWHNTWGGGGRDIYARRISATGQLLSSFTIAAGPHSHAQPSVAYDPVRDRYLVAWIYDVFGDGSDWDVRGRFIPWNGPNAALPIFTIIDWGSSQWNPKVAYARAQDEFLVVWTNTTTTPGIQAYVSGRRIFADGSGFPGGGFLIASHASEPRVNPDVSYNLTRNEYLVVFDNVVDIFGVRLQGNGNILGGGEFGIAGWPDTEQNPAVAACREPNQYLVVWQSLVGPGNFDVYGRYVHGNGTPGAAFNVENTVVNEIEADVACNLGGNQYLVVYQQQYSNASGPYGISARHYAPTAALTPPFPLSIPIAGQSVDRTAPVVAGGHVNFLTAWEHDRFGTAWQDIHGRLTNMNTLFLPMLRE